MRHEPNWFPFTLREVEFLAGGDVAARYPNGGAPHYVMLRYWFADPYRFSEHLPTAWLGYTGEINSSSGRDAHAILTPPGIKYATNADLPCRGVLRRRFGMFRYGFPPFWGEGPP